MADSHEKTSYHTGFGGGDDKHKKLSYGNPNQKQGGGNHAAGSQKTFSPAHGDTLHPTNGNVFGAGKAVPSREGAMVKEGRGMAKANLQRKGG